MADLFYKTEVTRHDPGLNHFTISPSDTVNLAVRPRCIYCVSAGTAVLVDSDGVALSYTLVSGQVLPFSPVRVNATGTTATLIGWF